MLVYYFIYFKLVIASAMLASNNSAYFLRDSDTFFIEDKSQNTTAAFLHMASPDNGTLVALPWKAKR